MLKAIVKCTQVISSENQSSLHDAVTNKAWSDANIRERVKPRYSIGADSASRFVSKQLINTFLYHFEEMCDSCVQFRKASKERQNLPLVNST